MKNLLFAAILLFVSTVAATAQTNYEAEIAALEAQDKATPPPTGGIVFVGSSSIRLWDGLKAAFPDKAIVQRGFGGSEISDVIRYMPRLVAPFAPKQIVLYAGDNDIGQSKLSARDVYSRFTTFFALARKQHPTATITFISIKPSPARRQFMAAQNEANQLIRKYVSAQKYASYIDVYTPMLNAAGQPRPELFGADSLHLNAQGYDLWKQVVGPVLK
jgi:lysophospholipase L1-like esterase